MTPASSDGRAPLLVTAELPGDILAWADALRREHYPPERNRLRAHVTLFHALPPSSEREVRALLAEFSRQAPPDAHVSGIMDLGRGTAIELRSAALERIYAAMSERLHGLLIRHEARSLRPHITIQNKVTAQAARVLQGVLAGTLETRAFRLRGLGLYAWEEGLWRPIRTWPFRGVA
ncbi:MAG: 2'-5' RNA ligase family protein [Novosphingobium sp.]|nr:2'-5' RNA ligase family protein [Novosphingobium sp.]